MQQRFLLQILLLAQHVSGTTMPIIRSSRLLYSGCCLWYFVLWFSSCWSGVELRVMCSGLQDAAASCKPEHISRVPPHVQNINLLWVLSDWIPFVWQTVFWISIKIPGSNFANNYRGLRLPSRLGGPLALMKASAQKCAVWTAQILGIVISNHVSLWTYVQGFQCYFVNTSAGMQIMVGISKRYVMSAAQQSAYTNIRLDTKTPHWLLLKQLGWFLKCLF